MTRRSQIQRSLITAQNRAHAEKHPSMPERWSDKRNADPRWTQNGKRVWVLHPTKGWRNRNVAYV